MLPHALPLFATLITLELGLYAWVFLMSRYVPEDSEAGALDAVPAAVFSGILLLPVVAALVWWLSARWVRGRDGSGAQLAGLAVVSVWVAAPRPVAQTLVEMVGGVVAQLAVALTLLGLIQVGAFTILRWSARRALAEIESLAPMVLRVLPVLMLTFLFFFFNAEIWQVAGGLDGARTTAVAGILIVLIGCVVSVSLGDQVRDLLRAQDTEHSAAAPLSKGEWLNFLLVPIVAQLIQVAMLALLVFAFFMTFGPLAVSAHTAKAWIGSQPTSLELLHVELPFSVELLKVSTMLAAFSGLSFAASSSADPQYKATFVAPILAETEENLAVRNAYLASLTRRD